jgi:hypothetical protein
MSENDSTSKGKAKRDSKFLSFVPVARPGKNLNHKEAEKLLRETGGKFKTRCRSLRELKPDIDALRAYFQEHVKGSVTLCGCRYFKDACLKFFGRSEQAIYAMLGNYSAKAKEKKKEEKEKNIQKPKPPASILDSPKNQEAAVLALSAVARFRTAKTEEEKTIAWTEYLRIADEGLQSVIGDDDQPHYMLMLLDLVVVTERLVAALNALNPELENVDEPIFAAARSCAEQAEKYCAAVRRRLNRPACHEVMPVGEAITVERKANVVKEVA